MATVFLPLGEEFFTPSFSACVEETAVISGVMCTVLLLLIPLWLFLAYHNSTTRSVLYSGWIPVLSAMGISR